MKKALNTVLLLCLTALIVACESNPYKGLQNGDLIFVVAGKNTVSKAIDRVTQTSKTTHYSHIALLEKEENGDLFVLHAAPKNGSERLPLKDFLARASQNHIQIDIYRLKKEYQDAISQAVKTAKTWLGKPYNYSYILSDEKLYCSDFIQRSFAKDSIFKLEPMTFKNPKTQQIDAVWKKYYAKQHLPVPEGKPGCNPNGMAASPKIKFVTTIDLK